MITSAKRFRLVVLLWLLSCTVGCDQVSKHAARSELHESGSIDLPGGFGRLEMAENPGSFLGLGDGLPALARKWVFTIGAGAGLLAVLIFLAGNARLHWLSFLGMALMLSGGVSNWLDRVFQDGLVTDFIYLRAGPFHTGIFNLADTMILAGGIVLLVSFSRAKPLPQPNP